MNTILRRLAAASALACCLLAPPGAFASPCAGDTVRFLVPFPASGSSADSLSRAVASKLGEMWDRNVIVDNRPGAGGIAATQAIANAAPDGCTIGLATAALAINPALMNRKLPYDTLTDLTMLSVLVDIPVGLFALPSLPAETVPELVAYGRTQAQGLTYATPGVGSGSHLAGALFGHLTGSKLVHVPYKGAAPAELDLLAGRVSLMFAAVSSEVAQVRAGRLKLIAVTGTRRFAGFPQVPTVAEAIPGYSAGSYFGVIGPGRMPKPLAARISRDIAAALGSTEVKARLDALQLVAVGSTPEAFEQLVRREIASMTRLAKATGLSMD